MDDSLKDYQLTPETRSIHGFWLDLGSRVEKDSGWIRIEWLLDNCLEKIMEGGTNIGALYRNPQDDSLWHYWLIAPHMAGGGPPALDRIDKERAMELFGTTRLESGGDKT